LRGAGALSASGKADLTRLKVAAGSRVSGPLMTAFSLLHAGDAAAAEVAVARRCWGLLASYAPALADLAALAGAGEEQQAAVFSALRARYAAAFAERLPPALAAAPACGAGAGGDGDGAAAQLTPQRRLAVQFRVWKKLLLWDVVLSLAPDRAAALAAAEAAAGAA